MSNGLSDLASNLGLQNPVIRDALRIRDGHEAAGTQDRRTSEGRIEGRANREPAVTEERPPNEAIGKGVSEGKGSFWAELEQRLAERAGEAKGDLKHKRQSSPKKIAEKDQKIVILGAASHIVEETGAGAVGLRRRVSTVSEASKKNGQPKVVGEESAKGAGGENSAGAKDGRKLVVGESSVRESKEAVNIRGMSGKDGKEHVVQPDKAVKDEKSNTDKTDQILASVVKGAPKEGMAVKDGKDGALGIAGGAGERSAVRTAEGATMGVSKPQSLAGESVESLRKDDRKNDHGKRDGGDDGQQSGRREGGAALKELQVEGTVKVDNAASVINKDASRVDASEGTGASVRTSMPGLPSGLGGMKEAAASVAGQIIESIRLDGLGRGSQIEINLQPAELGGVRIRMEQLNGEITGVLEVEKAQTRYELEKELPSIVAAMQHSGVAVRRVEVVMNQQTGDGAVGRERNYDFDAPHERQPDEWAHDDGGTPRHSSERRGGQAGEMTAEQARTMHISKDAINVYI